MAESSPSKLHEAVSSSTRPDQGLDTLGDSHEIFVKDDSSFSTKKEVDPSLTHPDKELDERDGSHETPVKDDSSFPTKQEVNSSLTHPDMVPDEPGDSHEAPVNDDSSATKGQEEDSSLTRPGNKLGMLGASHETPVQEDVSSTTKGQEDDSSSTNANKVGTLGDSHEAHAEDGSSVPKTQEVDPSSTHPDEEVDTLGDSPVFHVEDEPDAASNTAGSFVDFEEYRVNDIVVGGDRREIYNNNSGPRLHENLIQRQWIASQGFIWTLRFDWVNETSADNTYTRSVQEGLYISEGEETERNFGVSGAFRGLSISAGGSTKRFSQRETSRIVEVRKEVVVPAHSHTFFYQKEYRFLNQVWFWQRVPAWLNHNHFGVGRLNSGQRYLQTARTSIFSEEYATLNRRLTGTTTMSASGVGRFPDDPPVTRQFQNITQRAKDTLARWGIRG